MTTDRFRDRVRAANLSAQHLAVQAKAREILEALGDVENCVYWAVDGEDPPDHWAPAMIECAHRLIDLSYEYRQALAANPAAKISEDNSEESLRDPR